MSHAIFTGGGLTSPFTADNVYNDDVQLYFGTDSDIALWNNSAALTAGTGVTGVIIGTFVKPATAANSLIVSNVTASGDIMFLTNRGGNSEAHILCDGSQGETILYAAGVLKLRVLSTAVQFDTDINPYTDNGSSLGTTSARWSDLFLGTGAVINVGTTGNMTITHSSDLLTFAGGVVALGSVPTMTSPDITTSLTTPSTTFALANATATTINFAGAATTLNIGASACVLTYGGSITFTHGGASTFLTASASYASGPIYIFKNTVDQAAVEVLSIEGDRATMAANDACQIAFKLSDSAGNQDYYAGIACIATVVTNGAGQNGDLVFYTNTGNTGTAFSGLTEMLRLDGSTNNVVIGAGDAGTPAAGVFRGAQASGTDIAGANLTIQPAFGTGTGTAGQLLLRYAPVGSTGATLHVVENAITMIAQTGATGVSIDINASGNDRDTQIRGQGVDALFYVDASTDRIGIGTATPGANHDGVTPSTLGVQLHATSTSNYTWWELEALSVTDAHRGTLAFYKSGSTARYAVVAAGDELGQIIWAGGDGTDYSSSARITVIVEGTVAANDVGSYFVFDTHTPGGGANALIEALRIDSAQNLVLLTAVTMNAAAADKVSIGSIDVAAAHRSLAVQAENGSEIYMGSDRLSFEAATGGLRVSSTTDVLTFTATALTFADALNIVLNATTGTKIGTATTQKLGFYNATPIVQGASITDASGGATIDAEARSAVNAVISRLEALGLIATV